MSSPPGSGAAGTQKQGDFRRDGLRVEWLVALALAFVVLGPLFLSRGFALVGDMVFVPDQPWKDAWTGADGGVPRAVPGDAVVSVLSGWVGGELVQRLALAGALVAGFLGMCRLTAPLPLVARLAGALCFTWNPYVHERLAIGHWALLCGFAALPWVASAVVRMQRPPGGTADAGPRDERSAPRREWAVLLLALLVAGWASPTGGVLTVLTAVVLALPRRDLVLRVAAAGFVVNLPWILPALLNGTDQLAPDAFGAEAFAARADTPWGVVGSVLSFGGIWKETVVPDVRGDLFLSGVGLAVALLGLAGLLLGGARLLPRRRVLLLAAVSLVLALWGSWDSSRAALEWVVLYVPGGGLLRDAQKWAAAWCLVASCGFALAVAAVHRWVARWGRPTLSYALMLLPMLSLPAMAWMLAGFVPVAQYPAEWSAVREEMERRGAADDRVVVLPFSTYRQFAWTPRPVLDPAPRFFPGRMVTDDSLTVDAGTVGGESALAAEVRGASTPEELAEVLSEGGVRWALVHRSVDVGPLPAGAEVVLDGEELDLLRLGEPSGSPEWSVPVPPWAYVALDAGVLGGSLILVMLLVSGRNPSLRPSQRAYTSERREQVWED